MRTTPDYSSVTVPGLSLRLVETESELRQAQRLRYEVFFAELEATADRARGFNRYDRDEYDQYADHLLVLNDDGQIVGTYRLMRGEALGDRAFYTEKEFDIAKIRQQHSNIVELGRSCVAAAYRNHNVMDALWKGIALYVFHYEIELLFGCASFNGVDPEIHKQALSYLKRTQLAPEPLRVRARQERYIEMERMAGVELDHRLCIRALPPLIRGYLRLGGMVGDGAVIDHSFNTVDVCIIVERVAVKPRYLSHYQRLRQMAGG